MYIFWSTRYFFQIPGPTWSILLSHWQHMAFSQKPFSQLIEAIQDHPPLLKMFFFFSNPWFQEWIHGTHRTCAFTRFPFQCSVEVLWISDWHLRVRTSCSQSLQLLNVSKWTFEIVFSSCNVKGKDQTTTKTSGENIGCLFFNVLHRVK